MGQSLRILILWLLCFFMVLPAHAHGGREHTNKTVLIGTNISGLEGGSNIPGAVNVDYPGLSAADLDYPRSKNLNIVRIPFRWERIQPTLSGPLNTDYLAILQGLVTGAAARGQKISLDLHNYAQYGSYIFGDGTLTSDKLADVWLKIATVFANNPAVYAYDLMNEPCCGATPAAWKDAAQAAINAIRTVDMTTPIIVEGVGYASAYNWVSNGNDNLRTLSDPANKLVFSAHCYLDRDNSGQYFAWADEVAAGDWLDCPLGHGQCAPLDTNIGVKRLTPFFNWCNANHLTCNVGEMGAGNDNPNWLIALDKSVQLMQDNNVSFTYWNMGPWYGFYGYSINGQGAGKIDNPQMAVLTKYTNAYQPTIYTLSGPTRGTSGQPSAPFTVKYSGNIANPITITFNDAGGGGTFNPPSVTLQPGMNGAATTTYTAAASDTFKISATNSAGLTDPPTLGYSTASDLFMNASVQPNNIYWFSRIYAPYIGPAMKLRRASDNATQDFGFTSLHMNAPLDTAAILAWANGSNIYVVNWYDQSPHGYTLGPPNSADGYNDAVSTYGPASNADQPRLILSCQNGLPCLLWSNSRMDALSPLDGNPGETIISTAKFGSAGAGWKTVWDLVQYHVFASSAAWDGEPSVSMSADTSWHTYGARYRLNTTNGIQTYKDGTLVAQANSTKTSITFQYRTTVNFGYAKFFPATYAGYDAGTIIFPGALSDADMTALQALAKTGYVP